MKVEVVRNISGIGFSYSKGVQDIDKEQAEKLIKAGHAKPTGEETATKTAAEDTTTKRKHPEKKKSDS
ncbi:hypothetical protein [Salibacterium lacus]|uniref:Uncharacterized protein n=1 Tax=Salibacterium lacus TaxID=1898109 RepID=A0ABW5SWD6_9BACI